MKTCHKHIYFIILFSCLSLTIFGQELKLGLPLGHSKLESNYSQIDFSSDGKYIITTSKRKLFLWDVDSGKLLSVFFEQLGINTGCIVCFQVIRFSPDSKKIITITEDNQLEFWDVITGESLNSINLGKDDIYDIDFNELNNTLKICFRKENSKIWNLDNMQIIDSNADCSNNLPYGFRWSYNKKFKVFKNYNNQTVLLQCISEIQNYFNIDKWQINQPIIISEVENLIGSVKGVQTVEDITFKNINGESLGYSKYKYGFEKATLKRIIYPSMDPSIFELKYPNTDIKGKVVPL